MTFSEVVAEAAENLELVQEFNRLYGCNLGRSLKRQPIEKLVDRACGIPEEDPEDVRMFIWFVWEFVWTRLPR